MKMQPLTDCQVGIIGLGLMGGSLALALRGKVQRLIGVEKDPRTLSSALGHNVVDEGQTALTPVLKSVDLLILALPVKAIIETISLLPSVISENTLVIDLGSTKREIMQSYAFLPGSFKALGGHPMCGKESGGLANAEASLYQGATFALVKTSAAAPASQIMAETLVHTLGAQPLWISAEEHDAIVAGISHLPYLLSCGLVQSTPLSYAKLIGPGYRSVSRLAATPAEMMSDILETNQDQILVQLNAFIKLAQELHSLVKLGKFDDLYALLGQIKEKHHVLMDKKERIQHDGPAGL